MASKVSVVMTVYHGAQFLRPAIDSILHQLWSDFEFIIVNDGSTDSTEKILTEYEKLDRRVQVLTQSNLGIAAATNRGCQHAAGDYIARIDAEDLCLPHRFTRPVAFLKAHPAVGVCGTWAQIIGGFKNNVWRYPTEDDEIRSRLLFGSVLVHSAAIRRRTLLVQGRYPEPVFSQVLADRWQTICQRTTDLGLWTFVTFVRSPLTQALNVPLPEWLKFGRACLKDLRRLVTP